MLRQDDYQKAHLVTAGWRWGKEYGGHDAACMVMSVIGNRVRKGWGGWLEMIDRIPAFSAQLEQPIEIPTSLWEPTFVRLLHEVEGIYDGTAKDLSNGALYWADLRRVDNPWFKEKIIGNLEEHPRIGDINTFTLFK